MKLTPGEIECLRKVEGIPYLMPFQDRVKAVNSIPGYEEAEKKGLVRFDRLTNKGQRALKEIAEDEKKLAAWKAMQQ